jgi:hypothetical protein
MNSAGALRRRLIAANIVLAGVLGVVCIIPVAGASDGQPGVRARGAYTLVSGRIQGNTTHGVYILDSANQEVVALSWDRGQNRFNSPIGYRSLTQDAKAQHGAR